MRRIKRLSRRYVARQQKLTKRRIKHFKGHPFVVPVTTFLVLFFLSGIALVGLGGQTIGASDSRVVELSVDGEQRTVPTRAKDVKDLLKRLNIEVAPEDIVEPKLDTPILEDNFKVNVYKARPVTIIDNGRKQTVLSAHQQPRLIVEKAGVQLYPEDAVRTDEPVDVRQESIIGENVVVDRAVPAYLNLYGTPIELRTHADTVGELLEKKNVKTLEGDTVQPSRDTPVTPNIQVFVVRVGKQIVTEELQIEAPVETISDPNLAAGATVTKVEGSKGKKLVTYELDLRNGQEASRRVIQEVIAANPVKKVIVKGTKPLITGGKAEWMAAAGINPSQYQYVDYIVSRESGWRVNATNGRTWGLCQALPGSKMATAGADWQVNPVTQLKWCNGYATQRYGTWQAAYNFWVVNKWW